MSTLVKRAPRLLPVMNHPSFGSSAESIDWYYYWHNADYKNMQNFYQDMNLNAVRHSSQLVKCEYFAL